MSVSPQIRPDELAARRVIETDGTWCPMAHCNRLDDSVQAVRPLRSIRETQKITDPVVSPRGYIHLGAFTGRRMAVCTYAGRRLPAIVAFDYERGDVIWTSGPDDLVAYPERIPAGILMARMTVAEKPPRTYVFAANPTEFVAWNATGKRIWSRSCRDISPEARDGVGAPISISFTDSGELFAATTFGWAILLDPLDGSVIDAYRMDTNVVVDGRIQAGTFVNYKSPVIIGRSVYLLVEFRPAVNGTLALEDRPVHLVRLIIDGGRRRPARIIPLQSLKYRSDECSDRVVIGTFRGRGSPPGMVTRRGTNMVFATASSREPSGLLPVICGVEDDGSELTVRWRSVMKTAPRDRVHSAPGLHAASGTLLVSTRLAIFRFAGVDRLSGDVPSPAPLAAESLIERAAQPGVARVAYGSPFAICPDADEKDLVVSTNFILGGRIRYRTFGFLGAFALQPERNSVPRPLWSVPLATTASGLPAPGVGTFGQPALFERPDGRTGLMVATANSGTYILG